MTEQSVSLGPLAPAGGRWGIGDAERPGRHWVEFRPDGLCRHQPDAEEQLIPWSRVMTGIWITWGRFPWNTGSRGKYTLRGKVAGRAAGWLHMTLRHPYEDAALRFDRHEAKYRAVDAVRLEELLRQLVETDRLRLLGDPDWVGRAVAHLSGGGPARTPGALRRAVTEAIEAAGAAQ
ncbi:hypothetical protein [Streptomyces thermodiastaticus]|jgi:hypothetical protein|uniref:hypothetical protein n=1 Tax=Streptomyces thermodiastaticus TaxID=44061 RepID=UPI001678590A|nr:hypothetical protein [Streptomyces thermodiastaticus]MCE7553428.1 hypothetical protein [Streptomyces thermodiastaticus]GHF96907.1 hypothetical protein GCM10018787_51900 [Streptomyces thermodiastaticus]